MLCYIGGVLAKGFRGFWPEWGITVCNVLLQCFKVMPFDLHMKPGSEVALYGKGNFLNNATEK